MVPWAKEKQQMLQTKLIDQTKENYSLMPRNANAQEAPLYLECDAMKTLTEMLHEAVNNGGYDGRSMSATNIEVRFERGESSKFLGVEALQTQRLPLSRLSRKTCFFLSINRASL